MIYGYLRVSTDEQDINSQRQGVDGFATEKGWEIAEYITDEGVSGGKDPSKRKLGPLLEKLKSGDIVIASEISRLGRDLFMVMDILHHCMTTGCVVYTVKDRFVLGDDIQSKVLAFAFGLSAEIERQMIRQRTREGLRLRMKMGVLLGRPIGTDGTSKLNDRKEEVLQQVNWGVPLRRLAANFGVDRNTISRALLSWGWYDNKDDAEARRAKADDARASRRREASYKDEPWKVVSLDRQKLTELIRRDLTLPEISGHFPEYTYEQIYDTVSCDAEFNALYRTHGHRVIKRK